MTNRPSDNTNATQKSTGTAEGGKPRLVAVVWVLACVLIVVIVAGVYVIDQVISAGKNDNQETSLQIDSDLTVPQAAAAKLADAFESKTSVATLLLPVLQEIKGNPKLVVMTTTLNVTVKKENIKPPARGALDLGTTGVTLRANGNGVQYFVPLASAGIDSFRFDPATKVLTVAFPPVQLDKAVVDLQTTPAMIDIRTDAGWARLDRYSGEDLLGQARQDILAAVFQEAGMPILMEKARESARKKLMKMLEPVQHSIGEDVKLEVRFEDEPMVARCG